MFKFKHNMGRVYGIETSKDIGIIVKIVTKTEACERAVRFIQECLTTNHSLISPKST